MKGVWAWLSGLLRSAHTTPAPRGAAGKSAPRPVFDERKAIAEQFKRARQTQDSHPWLLLSGGPTREPCPVHAPDFGLVLPVDDPYWQQYPLRRHPGCKCRVRQISRREFERLQREGVQVPPSEGTAIRDAHGRLTGRHKDVRMPIKTRPAPRRT